MTDESRHFQSLSITLLAIGTAALGFGLFGAKFLIETAPYVSENADSHSIVESVDVFVKTVVVLVALFLYAMLVLSVRSILIQTEVTGEDVVQGPLFWMFELMVCIAAIFVMRVAGILVPA